MLRVTLRGAGVPAAVLGTGDRLMFGRAPGERLDALDPDSQLRLTTLALPRTAPHVSRVVGEVVVGEEGLEEGEAETSTCWYRGAFDLRYRRSCTPSLDCFFTRAF